MRRLRRVAALAVALAVLLAGCGWLASPPAGSTPAAAPTLAATRAFTPTPIPLTATQPTPRPSATPQGADQLTVCAGKAPRSLFFYDARSYAQAAVLEALYDGPVDTAQFGQQPVILQQLPSAAAGELAVRPVAVRSGAAVVDNNGRVIELAPGNRVRPSGCQSAACAVPFNAGSLELDQVTITYTLRAGVRWSDGEPVTAADAVFSFRLAGAVPPNADRRAVERTASFTALDERTVVWTGLPGYVPRNVADHFWTPLPAHAWSAFGTRRLGERDEPAQRPLGYGAYMIEEWARSAPDSQIVLRRNPYYFRAAEGLPRFERLVFRFVGTPQAGLSALAAGECDVLAQDLGLEAFPNELQALQAGGQAALHSWGGPAIEFLFFGIYPVPPDRPPALAQTQVRQALAFCLDRGQLAEAAGAGRQWVTHSYVSPEHPLYAREGLATYPFDPVAGQALLDDAGWRDEDGDAVREAHGVPGVAEGTPLVLRYVVPDSPARRALAELVAAGLAACGARAQPELLGPDLFEASPYGLVYGRRFHLAQFDWPSGEQPPCELFLSANIPVASNGYAGPNITGYGNPIYDAVCAAALDAPPGSPNSSEGHLTAQILFSRDLPALPLFVRPRLAVTRPDLAGFAPSASEATEFWNIEAFGLAP